ncbi:quaternary ammonium compound-resistance protein SugE [Prauserella isguenensis]|uniref:Quaternary ammonium compound-resistance protein SugE n=1 Tax=Prauserella isguenensis TaxID=1470180 RepID=A0A839S5V5_9PSEU|nr:multidrug efflux SMR transporter [Prauserella isguenensis]MBB3052057.1 quaternary ammonium compound-resistance protein SugE [Prauserella isguenensis]
MAPDNDPGTAVPHAAVRGTTADPATPHPDETDPGTPTATPDRRGRAWLVLLLAGGFEVGYALAVGGSEGFTVASWSAVAVVFFLLTLFALSVALRTIDVGIGYAVWAGTGAVGAATLGPVFFDESPTLATAGWLAVIIAGLVWLKLADRPVEPDPTDRL